MSFKVILVFLRIPVRQIVKLMLVPAAILSPHRRVDVFIAAFHISLELTQLTSVKYLPLRFSTVALERPWPSNHPVTSSPNWMN